MANNKRSDRSSGPLASGFGFEHGYQATDRKPAAIKPPPTAGGTAPKPGALPAAKPASGSSDGGQGEV